MNKNLLLIFVKNPQLGKVKTRLAATLGDHKALEIYNLLLEKTKATVLPLAMDKQVYYSDFIGQNDLWSQGNFQKRLQFGDDLGARMSSAFKSGFDQGYESICIIGSDCFDISKSIINQAFETLKSNDFVMGPAKDGGYYLLGMNKYQPGVFENIKWSTVKVLSETINRISKLKASYDLLISLTDIDEEKDLETISEFINTER